MDPTNNNPINTPNPTPAPQPEPQISGAPQVGATASPTAAGVPQSAPQPAPVPPAQAGGVAQGTPAGPSGVQPPVVAAPVNPVINPSTPLGQSSVGATEAIMRPELTPPPDPIEEELKAPMKAAGPAPGSIGSAVSGPAGTAVEGQTPSVSFNDPAKQPDMASTAQPGQSKKKSSRKTLIILIIVAAIVVVALAVVLLMQLGVFGGQTVPGSGSSSSNTANNSSVNVDDNSSSDVEEDTTADVVSSTLSCTRNMTAAELANYNNATSGTVSISGKFDDTDMLSTISVTKSVVYDSQDITQSEPENESTEEAVAADLTAEDATTYYLPVSTDGTVDLALSDIQTNYASLDFICEAL